MVQRRAHGVAPCPRQLRSTTPSCTVRAEPLHHASLATLHGCGRRAPDTTSATSMPRAHDHGVCLSASSAHAGQSASPAPSARRQPAMHTGLRNKRRDRFRHDCSRSECMGNSRATRCTPQAVHHRVAQWFHGVERSPRRRRSAATECSDLSAATPDTGNRACSRSVAPPSLPPSWLVQPTAPPPAYCGPACR